MDATRIKREGVYVLLGGLGYGLVWKIAPLFPNVFVNWTLTLIGILAIIMCIRGTVFKNDSK